MASPKNHNTSIPRACAQKWISGSDVSIWSRMLSTALSVSTSSKRRSIGFGNIYTTLKSESDLQSPNRAPVVVNIPSLPNRGITTKTGWSPLQEPVIVNARCLTTERLQWRAKGSVRGASCWGVSQVAYLRYYNKMADAGLSYQTLQ